jgi:hypothetical protein
MTSTLRHISRQLFPDAIIQSLQQASGVEKMKDNLPRFTLRIEKILLDKLAYISESEGRTKNKEIEQLIKKRIAEYESLHGEIKT